MCPTPTKALHTENLIIDTPFNFPWLKSKSYAPFALTLSDMALIVVSPDLFYREPWLLLYKL